MVIGALIGLVSVLKKSVQIASGEAARAVPGRRRAKGGREVSPKPSQTHASGALAYRAAAE